MPKYLVEDSVTGKKFQLEGDSPPTEQELTEIFAQNTGPTDVFRQRAKSRLSPWQTAGEGLKNIAQSFAPPEGDTVLERAGKGLVQPFQRGLGILQVVGAPGQAISNTIGSGLMAAQEAGVGKRSRILAGGSGAIRGLLGIDKNTMTEALEARGMASPVAFGLDMLSSGALDPSAKLGRGAARVAEVAAAGGYKGLKGKTLAWITRHPEEKVKHLVKTGFRGADKEFFQRGTVNMAQDFTNQIEKDVDELLYKPATKMWDDLSANAAKNVVPPMGAASLRNKLDDILSKDPTAIDDTLRNLLDEYIPRPNLNELRRGTGPKITAIELLRLHRNLRARARRDPAAAKLAEALGDVLSANSDTFKAASEAWKKYAQTRRATDVLYGSYNKKVTGESGEKLARGPELLFNYLKEADNSDYRRAAKVVADNLEAATKAPVAQQVSGLAPAAPAATTRGTLLENQQARLTQQFPELPPAEGGPLTTLRRNPATTGVPPGRALTPSTTVDTTAEISGELGPVASGSVPPPGPVRSINAKDMINRMEDISALHGLDVGTPRLSGITYAGGAGALLGGSAAAVGAGGATALPLSALGAWIFKEAIPRMNIRSAANTAARYRAIRNAINNPRGKAMSIATGLTADALGEALVRGSYNLATQK